MEKVEIEVRIKYDLQSHRHHHTHQGLDPVIRSVSRVTTAPANVSSVFRLIYRVNLYYFVKRHTKFATKLVVGFPANFNIYP
jgi:hypothetical protein